MNSSYLSKLIICRLTHFNQKFYTLIYIKIIINVCYYGLQKLILFSLKNSIFLKFLEFFDIEIKKKFNF